MPFLSEVDRWQSPRSKGGLCRYTRNDYKGEEYENDLCLTR
jgi:hypothetical protein